MAKTNVNQATQADVAPQATDDSSKGIIVGSIWFDQVAGGVYICTSAVVGAAVWKKVAELTPVP